MTPLSHCGRQPCPLRAQLHRGPVAAPRSLFLVVALCATTTTAVATATADDDAAAAAQTTRAPVEPLSGGASTAGIIIGCVVAIVGVLLVSGLVALVCILRRRRRLGFGRGRVYGDADSIALQDDNHHHHHHLGPGGLSRGGNEGTDTAGLYSHHTVDSNEPVTPPQNPNTPQMRDRRDNYADRFDRRSRFDQNNNNGGDGEDGGYDADDGVRPASPTADRVEGVTIENRIRPRRHLPRGQVVIHHDNQDVCLDFRGVERVPQAGPPPLTAEEKQRIIDAQNRVASPEFYGRAEYEYRRASNNNTPNVLLSSSLLRELQQQYAAASASGQVFPSYASEAGRSIGSMSFRPGSPAGSVRRHRRDDRQSTSPTSVTINAGGGGDGAGQNLRHRKNGSRHHTGTRDGSGGAAPHASISRHYREDLESTSDDFEDLSLHNDSFTGRREKLRDAAGRPVPMQPGSGFPPLAGSLGFDQMSLRSNSPLAFERYMSATASVSGAGAPSGGLNASMLSAYGVPSPLDHPQDGLPPAALAHTPHGQQSTQSTSINSPVASSAGYPTLPRPSTSTGDKAHHQSGVTNGSRNATLTASSQTPKSSSTASPGVQPFIPGLSPLHSPPSPPNPIINFIGVPNEDAVSSAGRGNATSPSGHQQQQATPPVFLTVVSGHRDARDTAAPLPHVSRSDGAASAGTSRGQSTHSKSD